MGTLKFQIWHCFDTPKGRFISPEELDRWHRAPRKNPDGTFTYLGRKYKSIDYANVQPEHKGHWGRGWDRDGYTGYYQPDGTYVLLTPHNNDDIIEAHEMTWGASGVNAIAQHKAYAGGKGAFGLHNLTDEQFVAIERDMREFIYLHPNALIGGHYHFSEKPCPNFPVWKMAEMIGIPKQNILYDEKSNHQ